MWLAAVLAAGMFSAGAAQASVTFTGSSGSLAASVTFERSGADYLIVTLTNTSAADALVPTDILSAVFFDLDPATPTLTPISALLGSGSNVYNTLTGAVVSTPGGVVGGEWAYKSGATNPPPSDQGVSSSGLGIFGVANLFPPGTNLQGPNDPDGIQYGITSAGDNVTTGNGGIASNKVNLIKNSVVFTMRGFSYDADVTHIKNVRFQYGTALGDTSFSGNGPPSGGPTVLPEPASLVAWSLLGLIGLAYGYRRRLAA